MTDGKREISEGKRVVMDLVEAILVLGGALLLTTGSRTVQKRHNSNWHNALQQKRDLTRIISSVLPIGWVLKHFWVKKIR
jgi:hypothetical protein